MRMIQIIDSLEAGGAERMAVNYANALSKKTDFSGLIATRKEGVLLEQIDKKVPYLFLNRKGKIDLKAVFNLRKNIVQNNIEIIHAHSSSFFIAVLLKLTLPRIRIIWHDHYGISQDLSSRKNFTLKLSSLFFSGIIAVNSDLKKWSESYLWCKNVIYLPNFIETEVQIKNEKINLHGKDGKRIICVANLRPQKNHQLLFRVANKIKNKFPDWTFHLLGKDFHDDYSEEVKKTIVDLNLEKNVFFYGTVKNVALALKQCDIAILTSSSEGLPLAILEYGLHKLPVIATDVGEISKVISLESEGIIVRQNDSDHFEKALEYLIVNENHRKDIGKTFYAKIQQDYSESAIINKYTLWLNTFMYLPLNN